MTTPILATADLDAYYGPVLALHKVAIQIRPGQIVTIIGPNGAGKSTLLGAIMGSLPANARTAGSIRFNEQNITPFTVSQRVRNGLCLVPEKRELFGSMSVEENLRLGAFVHRRDPATDSVGSLQEVFELFPRLKERRKQEAHTLSGGERQMLALGRALMAKPKLLLLDEPSLGLAPLIVKEIFKIIEDLKANGVSVLLVEQNARAALKVADYAYVLETGEIALEGPGAVLQADTRIAEMYLGVSAV